tara:strand:- start:803 stop:1297 length:495 start_codon:yes stop_codon:yes gene_type:complete
MPATYEPIATTTLGSNAASYTFSSIPGTYTDLVLIVNGGATSATYSLKMQVNGDTASNYSDTSMQGNGTTAASNRNTSNTSMRSEATPTTTLNSVWIANFMNYANTTTNKTVLVRGNNASALVAANVNLWRSTAAITSIKVFFDATLSNILSGTSLTLYGIKAA